MKFFQESDCFEGKDLNENILENFHFQLNF